MCSTCSSWLEHRKAKFMQEQILFDQDFLEKLKTIAREGVNNAASGFSGMVGRKI